MTKVVKCEVREVGDDFGHVPWGVYLGKILVSRHASELEAGLIRDKLNRKIERRDVLAVVTKAIADIESGNGPTAA